MRATIMPQENNIRINDEPITVAAGLMPAGPVLDGYAVDPKRPVEVIHFDGAIGTIQRESRAPGRIDVEYFVGDGPLAPYVSVYAAEKARLAAEKAAKDAETEAKAKHAAELAAQAASK